MLSLIITLALLGLIVWAITTYIPMPPVFKTVIYIVAAVCLIMLLMRAFGVVDIPVPQIR